jgi:hypothetical protein
MRATLFEGTVLEHLATMADGSFDAVLTDVPYGLGTQPSPEEILAYLGGAELVTGDFMARDWSVPSVHTWREILRALKPGGYVLTFAGPRTVDLISLGLRMAGFEVRDVITYAWTFGTGFPKSQDASKALDNAAGADREVVGPNPHARPSDGQTFNAMGVKTYPPLTAPASDLAAAWEGYGTALKPAFEPIILARKPMIGTLAENIAAHGTGALNIDASRIEGPPSVGGKGGDGLGYHGADAVRTIDRSMSSGRWPANVILDDGAAALLDAQTGDCPSSPYRANHVTSSVLSLTHRTAGGYSDTGGASRFFYVAKASREERDLGCDDLPFRTAAETTDSEEGQARLDSPRTGAGRTSGARNHHPCVKPVDLCRWLAGLLLPPPREGAPRRLLVPYAGSGSEMIGGLLAGWDEVVGIEMDPEFCPIARARIALAESRPGAFAPDAAKPKTVDPRQASLFGGT